MPSYELTDAQLLLLDGKCDAKLQTEVDRAKQRLDIKATIGDAPEYIRIFVSAVVQHTIQEGVLHYSWTEVHYCRLCNRSAGYHKYTSTTRYHTKGEENGKRPLSWIGGVIWGDSYYPKFEFCPECEKQIMPLLKVAVAELHVELPEKLTGVKPRYLRSDNQHCKKCGWTGHKLQLKRQAAIMGGWVHVECPKCGADRNLFSHDVETVKGFVTVDVAKEINPKTHSVDWSES